MELWFSRVRSLRAEPTRFGDYFFVKGSDLRQQHGQNIMTTVAA